MSLAPPEVSGSSDAPTAGTTPAPTRRTDRGWSRDRIEGAVLGIGRWVVIAGFLFISLFPFYLMIVLSMRSIDELLADPGSLLPESLDLSAYSEVLASVADGGQGFLGFLTNSALVAGASVLLALALAIPGAYAIARLPFFGRRKVSALFLAVYLFPAIVLAIPLFVLFTKIGLRGSLVGLVLVYCAQTVPVAIYTLRNYFEAVPESVEEAGLIDGLNRYQVIWKISLPLARPSILATGIFVFMIAWNEFLFALLFLVDQRDRWTVSLGLSQLAGSIEVPTTILMAGSVVITVPIILLFFLTERLLTEGLASGAEKG